ncbi:cytochrome b/b6 domain-containing protein [Gimibacter soli]|uniref:Cytochrome b/b6 domain-containing protein n=1 Tax=Gimibacter soli TaxID=3024400 RepID=A0AAE9XRA9_9PROT|nr:cytochrome b/b6 domain-containing protein [Gimibacter soli]WCL54787.1 cytochrome b/b6 domain-containing protein [Gimibacter soli]
MKRIQVWDLPTRLFHWALVIAVALSAYSAFEDKFGVWAKVHLYAGLTILGLILWRLVWGFIGSETSRFSHFLKGPKAVAAYARQADAGAHVGHNPVGGWSVVAMLVVTFAQAALGLFATDDMFFSGPLASKIDGGMTGTITEIHEVLGFTLFGLIGLHVAAVLYYRIVKRVDLVRPMVTGSRDVAPETKEPARRHGLWAIVSALLIGGGVAYFSL